MLRVKPTNSASPANLCVVGERCHALFDCLSSILIAFVSVVRGLPLFMAGRPMTPLRVLCIMAFDAVYRHRYAKHLPQQKLRTLAALLDCGACANAACDDKDYCHDELRITLRLLNDAGIGSAVGEYLRRLTDLERRRPSPGGDLRQFHIVRSYREAVVRLSLGMIAATSMDDRRLDEQIRASYRETDLNLLFRIVMQCQVIDDVLDYAKDLSAGLPSFLTASRSLPQALEQTRLAAFVYADTRDLPRTGECFPFRIALWLVSAVTKLAIRLGGRRALKSVST